MALENWAGIEDRILGSDFRGVFKPIKELGKGGMGRVIKVEANPNSENYSVLLSNIIACLKARSAPELNQYRKKVENRKKELNKTLNLEQKIFSAGKDQREKKQIQARLRDDKRNLRIALSRYIDEQTKYIETKKEQWSRGFSAKKLTSALENGGISLPKDHTYALKVTLDNEEQTITRMRQEWRSLVNATHPNIVNYYFGGDRFAVMEFLNGVRSPEDIVKNDTIGDRIKHVMDAANGLGHAHKHGLIHRDIKPDNIAVCENGIVKVVDFGIVKTEGENITQTGTVMGTPNYMSPEQINAQGLDERTDIYSLGASLYYYICEKAPFSKKIRTNDGSWQIPPFFEIQRRVSEEKLKYPRNIEAGLDQDLKETINVLMAKEREKRPQSMEEVRDILSDYINAYRDVTQRKTLVNFNTTANKRKVDIIRRGETSISQQYDKKALFGGIAAGIAIIGAVLGYGLFSSNNEPVKPVKEPVKKIIKQEDYSEEKQKIQELSSEIIDIWEQKNIYDNSKVQEFVREVKSLPFDEQRDYDSLVDEIKEIKEINEDFNEFKGTYKLIQNEVKNLKGKDLERLDDRVGKLYDKAVEFKVKGVLDASDIASEISNWDDKIDERKILVKNFENFVSDVEEDTEEIKKYLSKDDITKESIDSYLNVVREDREKAKSFKGFDTDFNFGYLEAQLRQKRDSLVEEKPEIEYSNEYYTAKDKAENLMKEAQSIFGADEYNKTAVQNLQSDIVNFHKYVMNNVPEKNKGMELRNKIGTVYKNLNDLKGFFEHNKRMFSDLKTLDEKIEDWQEKEPSQSTVQNKIEDIDKYISILSKKGKLGKEWLTKAQTYKEDLEGMLIPEGSVLYMSFDEDTIVKGTGIDEKTNKIINEGQGDNWYVKDLSGKGNHGVIHGMFPGLKVYDSHEQVPPAYDLALVKGPSGKPNDWAMYFAGKEGYVEIPRRNDSFDFGTDDFDVSLMVYDLRESENPEIILRGYYKINKGRDTLGFFQQDYKTYLTFRKKNGKLVIPNFSEIQFKWLNLNIKKENKKYNGMHNNNQCNILNDYQVNLKEFREISLGSTNENKEFWKGTMDSLKIKRE